MRSSERWVETPSFYDGFYLFFGILELVVDPPATMETVSLTPKLDTDGVLTAQKNR